MIREAVRRYRECYDEQGFTMRALFSAVFFALSITASFFAIGYTNTHASNGVTDLVLSNIPVFDVDGYFVYGTFILVAFIMLLCFMRPKRIPFVLDALALFWFIRSGFTSLTHIGPFATQTPFDLKIALDTVSSRFLIGDDFFFSGHVGVPFLMALLFWPEKHLRYLFLGWSAYFAVIVLMGHLHYSIDVASAFFITYSIYHIARWLFPREQELLRSARVMNPQL